jgi:diacylglycerol kinase (ATP)
MMEQKYLHIFLIINPVAGHKKGKRRIGKLIAVLRERGCSVEYAFTRHTGHAIELSAKAAAAGYGLVVAVGGDGTVNEVAQGLIGTAIPMGIVPWGSGNGLARELGIPASISACSRMFMKGSDRQIDVCKFNNQRFLCSCGTGFNALIADKMSKATSRGFVKYIQLTIRESFYYKPVRIKLLKDGVWTEKSVFMITFANAAQFGNDAFIAPGASMNDELIDVVIVNPFNKIILPLMGLALFLKFISRFKFVESFRAHEICLEADDNPVFYFDGEPVYPDRQVRVTVDKEKLIVRSK